MSSSALGQSLSVPSNGDPNPRLAPAMTVVGAGTTDPSTRQLVRTSADRLYLFAPDGSTYPTNPGSHLRAWQGNRPGTPTGFVNADAAHSPGGEVNSSAAAIDGADRAHVIWLNRSGQVDYAVFDTKTNRWGPVTLLEATGWTDFSQGDEGVAIAVDAAGVPHAAWTYRDAQNVLRLHYANRLSGAWSVPLEVDDVTVAQVWHPCLAFAPNGDLLAAWIDGKGGYSLDGIVRTRLRTAAGTWLASSAVPGDGGPDLAETGLDNGPSILITADGTRHITYGDTTNAVRYYYDAGQGWQGDRQPPHQVTHDPVLGLDGLGGLYIYGHATPDDDFRGYGPGKLRFHLPAGSTAWGPYLLIRNGPIDDATTARWSQFFYNHPEEVDFTFWTVDPNNQCCGYVIYTGTDTVMRAGLGGLIGGAIDLLPSVDENPAGLAEAFRLTASASGTTARIGVFVDDASAAARISLGLYSDAGGRPGALLATGTLTGTTAAAGQWHEAKLGSVAISADASYWIAVLSPSGGGTVKFRDTPGGGGASVVSAQANLGTLPRSWASGTAGSDGPLAAYLIGSSP